MDVTCAIQSLCNWNCVRQIMANGSRKQLAVWPLAPADTNSLLIGAAGACSEIDGQSFMMCCSPWTAPLPGDRRDRSSMVKPKEGLGRFCQAVLCLSVVITGRREIALYFYRTGRGVRGVLQQDKKSPSLIAGQQGREVYSTPIWCGMHCPFHFAAMGFYLR